MTPRPRRFVPYYRVSTARQGRSGLGLEGQRAAVEAYLAANNGVALQSFSDVQSGKDDDRPQLAAALKFCRATRATLLIAKIDRLSRNAAFLLTLQDSGARFVACDLPDMNETVVGIMAVIAQAERRMIGERTKAALAAAKARGVRLGNPHLKPGTRSTALRASRAASSRADRRAEDLRDIVDAARAAGCSSLRSIAAHLNDAGVATSRGSTWTAGAVSRLLARL